MTIDPATAAFLRILNESTDIHGGNKKKSFKGNYGGGNEYYQLEPDTELDNMRERVLGSEINELDVVPGSMTVNPNNFEKYKSTLQGDLKGENIKPFKYAPPKGFNVVDKKFPKVKQAPKESIEGKELGENKNDDGRRVIDDSMLVDDSENGAARGSTPSRTSITSVSQILELPGVLTVGLSESTIEKIDEALDAMIESEIDGQVNEDLRKWFGKGKEGGVGGGGWDRYNTKGERIGKCGDAEDRGGKGEGKPKCLSKEKAAELRAKGGKKAIANAVRRKKEQDPVTNRRGTGNPPKNVSESIILEKNVPTNPKLWSRAKAAAKKKFDVYPSAYANGWAAKWYKKHGGSWKKSKKTTEGQEGCTARI